MGFVADLAGDDDAALDYYRRAAGVRPPSINSLLNLGVLYEDRGEYSRAADCYRRVLQDEPSNARAAMFVPTTLKEVRTIRSRMSVSPSTRQLLWAKAGGVCAFPDCRTRLIAVGPANGSAVLIGEIAHIVGQHEGSARFGLPIPGDIIDGVANLLVLCPTCRTKLKRVCPSCGKLIRPEWSICPYCAVSCAQLVYAKGNDIIHIEGDPRSPINQGTLCPKGAATLGWVVNPHRLTTVKYRASYSDRWEERPLDWAMDRIAHLIKRTRDETFVSRLPDGTIVNHTLGMASLGGATLDNEENYLIKKLCGAGLGMVWIENQARV